MEENSINIKNENEVELYRRTKENYTHEVLKDRNIKEITTWKRTKTKLCYCIFYNILTCGIISIISKYRPLLFIKLYCTSSIPEEADYFLVKDIYGEYKLCKKEIKRNKYISSNWEISEDLTQEYIPGIISNNKNVSAQMTGFYYNSYFYEFSESMRKIFPIFFNLNNLTNREIIKLFMDGLSDDKVKKYKERFGLNICPINQNLISLYFVKVELFLLISSAIISVIEIFLGNRTYSIIMIVFIALIFLQQITYLRKISFNDELTLESANTKIKVKRKNSDNPINGYSYINYIDLLPGDAIYLKEGETVPCDGIILEGECFVDISSVNGILAEKRKKSLDNKNIKFNYEENKNSILLHGSKIMKAFSRLENNSILLLCINTGNNSYKANQLENIFHLFKRNKKYRKPYSMICGKRKKLFLHCLGLVITTLTSVFCIFFFSIKKRDSNSLKEFFLIIFQVVCRCFLPTFHVINSAIILFSSHYLAKENILCYDKSRLLYAGFINTVFFDKTGTLSENCFDINGFFPVSIIPNKSQLYLKCYFRDQVKVLTSELIDYYISYIKDTQNLIDNDNNNNNFQKFGDLSKYMTALYFECMMCCNSLEKVNNRLFGNTIEREVFGELKWEFKIINENSNEENARNKRKETDTFNKNSKYSKYNVRVLKQKVEIYPNNYYKIMEGNQNFNNQFSNYYNNNSKNNTLYSSGQNSSTNRIIEDINKNKNNCSYKLQIYKRYIKIGTLYSSAIVYNPLTKHLRFMTKGPIEDVIPNCDANYLPKDFSQIISFYRRNGYDMLIMASKIINKNDYDDSLDEDYYMNNLIFCGIITLKNRLKDEAKQVIPKLKKLNCDIILNTGDNVYNALSVSFETGIVSSKNVFVFDFDTINKKIILNNFTEVMKIEQSKTFLEKTPTNNFIQQRQTKNNIYSTNKLNAFIHKLERFDLSMGKSDSHRNLESNKDSNLFSDSTLNITSNKNLFFKKIANIKFDNYNKSHHNKDIDSSKESFKIKKPIGKQISLEVYNLQNSRNLFEGADILKGSMRKNFITNFGNNTKRPLLGFLDKIKGRNKRGSISSDKNINSFSSQRQQFGNSFYYKRNPTKSNIILPVKLAKTDNEYYSSRLKEMRNNCVYCVSGLAFKFILENRFKSEYKQYEFPILLNHIQKFGKIFYGMRSNEKSLLIDYFRKIPNKITCMIGDGQNDIDAIMTSHVGININPPINKNTILCHFHPTDGSLLCIEKIIKYGKVTFENIYLFAITTFYWTTMTMCYISFVYNGLATTDKTKLDFISYFFFVLSLSAFTAKPNFSTNFSPLFHNYKLFTRYFFIQSGTLLIVIILYNYLFIISYRKNEELEDQEFKKIYGTYYYIFNVFMMLSTQFSINSINFYRVENTNNFIYFFLLIFLFMAFSFIMCIFGYSFHPIISSYFDFEFSSKNVDAFDDGNKLICFIIFLANVITCYIIVMVLFTIFKKKAQSEFDKKENQLNS